MPSTKKGPRISTGGANNRRLSLEGAMIHTPKATHSHRSSRKSDQGYQDDGFTGLSTAQRGLYVASILMRNHSFGAREPNSPMLQKPFSPISSTTSSKSNLTTYFSEDQNIACETTLQSTLRFTTPIKTTTAITNEENKTQRLIALQEMWDLVPKPTTSKDICNGYFLCLG